MNWIEELDDILATAEDTLKGREGDLITKARGLIEENRKVRPVTVSRKFEAMPMSEIKRLWDEKQQPPKHDLEDFEFQVSKELAEQTSRELDELVLGAPTKVDTKETPFQAMRRIMEVDPPDIDPSHRNYRRGYKLGDKPNIETT